MVTLLVLVYNGKYADYSNMVGREQQPRWNTGWKNTGPGRNPHDPPHVVRNDVPTEAPRFHSNLAVIQFVSATDFLLVRVPG
jgi:hypothetical protein